jgi:hypothetical protein
MLFWTQLEAAGLSGATVRAVPYPVRTAASSLAAYATKHLRDARFHVALLNQGGYAPRRDALVRAVRDLGGLPCLLVLGRNLRRSFPRPAADSVATPEVQELLACLRGVAPAAALCGGITRERQRAWELLSAATFRDAGPFLLAAAPLYTNGSGPLHYAAEHGATGIVEDLIFFFGAAAFERGGGGRSPADFARKAGHAELAEWLTMVAAEQAALEAD